MKNIKSNDYKYLKSRKEIRVVDEPPRKGTWLPVATVANITGWSTQTLRLWFFKGKIDGLRVKKSVLMINLNQVQKIKKEQ